jgi:hypothetical protein
MDVAKTRSTGKKTPAKKSQKPASEKMDKTVVARLYHANLEIVTLKCDNKMCKEKSSDVAKFACVVRLYPNNTVYYRADGNPDAFIVPFKDLKKEKSVGMISVETKQVRVVTLTII